MRLSPETGSISSRSKPWTVSQSSLQLNFCGGYRRRGNMRWLKWLGGIVGALALLVGVVFAWGALEYSDHPLIPHKRVTITLPFGAETEATGIRAMGEVEQYHPFGHPGIDFQWEHSVPLIAVADGTITSISRAEDMGEPVWYVL